MKIDPTETATMEPVFVQEEHDLVVFGRSRHRQGGQQIENLIPIPHRAARQFADDEWMG